MKFGYYASYTPKSGHQASWSREQAARARASASAAYVVEPEQPRAKGV
jgi:hypothetical protein